MTTAYMVLVRRAKLGQFMTPLGVTSVHGRQGQQMHLEDLEVSQPASAEQRLPFSV